MKLFKNQLGFNDVVTMTVIGGILGSLFITGVFVWKEIEIFNARNQVNQVINKIVSIKQDYKVEETKKEDWQVYTNEDLGFSIKYPKHYSAEISDKKFTLVTKFLEKDYLGRGASVSISFATDEGDSLQGFDYYIWAKNGFLENIVGFYDKEVVNINNNKFTVFNVASGTDNVRKYFLFKDDALINITDSRLGVSEQNFNEKIIFTFKFLEDDNISKAIDCLPEQRNIGCEKIRQPVCATVNVQCFSAPCPSDRQDFGNPCMACTNSLVSDYTKGECHPNKVYVKEGIVYYYNRNEDSTTIVAESIKNLDFPEENIKTYKEAKLDMHNKFILLGSKGLEWFTTEIYDITSGEIYTVNASSADFGEWLADGKIKIIGTCGMGISCGVFESINSVEPWIVEKVMDYEY